MQSEDEVVAQSAMTVTLGGTPYDIKPLTLGKAMAWRKKFAPELSKIMAGYGMQSAGPQDYLLAFVDSAELMTGVVFGYAPDLPQDTILDSATEQEMFQAFATVMAVAFGPFLGEAMFLTQFKKQMEKAAASVSEPSSRLQ
jgi:hypothetical protein